jgi:hypothetical protein
LPSDLQATARINDEKAKARMKTYNDEYRNTTSKQTIKVGDTVLLLAERRSKSDPLYEREPFTVIKLNGTMASIKRGGQVLARNVSKLKPYKTSPIWQVPEEDRARERRVDAAQPQPQAAPQGPDATDQASETEIDQKPPQGQLSDAESSVFESAEADDTNSTEPESHTEREAQDADIEPSDLETTNRRSVRTRRPPVRYAPEASRAKPAKPRRVKRPAAPSLPSTSTPSRRGRPRKGQQQHQQQ